MGDIADMLIDGTCDMYTGEYIGEAVGYPRTTQKKRKYYGKKVERTPAEKKIASIRKEIAINIKNGMKVGEARRQANVKYGKGWRERGLVSNSDNQWTTEDLQPYL